MVSRRLAESQAMCYQCSRDSVIIVQPLSLASFHDGVKHNSETMLSVLGTVIAKFGVLYASMPSPLYRHPTVLSWLLLFPEQAKYLENR